MKFFKCSRREKYSVINPVIISTEFHGNIEEWYQNKTRDQG